MSKKPTPTRGPIRPISQEHLGMLRDLRIKQGELLRLEARLARKTIQAIEQGAVIEPGRHEARIVTHQRGRRLVTTLCVW